MESWNGAQPHVWGHAPPWIARWEGQSLRNLTEKGFPIAGDILFFSNKWWVYWVPAKTNREIIFSNLSGRCWVSFWDGKLVQNMLELTELTDLTDVGASDILVDVAT